MKSIGLIIAVALSWTVNHGVWWAILHAIFGWWYVIYWGFKYALLDQFIQQLIQK